MNIADAVLTELIHSQELGVAGVLLTSLAVEAAAQFATRPRRGDVFFYFMVNWTKKE